MAIPDYQTFMLPALRAVALKDSSRISEIAERAADALAVPHADRATMLPSGNTTALRSRVGWALTYMKQAAFVETISRGVYRITDRGRDVLARNPARIDNTLLQEFDEFRAFLERSRTATEPVRAPSTLDSASSADSPEEALDTAYKTLRADLVTQLVDVLKNSAPTRFEAIVIDVLQALGYGRGRVGAARTIGRSGDGGIDGVIDEDRLGLDAVYVQAKRWEGTVGRPTVQAFAGALQGQRAHKGVLITTSDFTAEARAYAKALSTRIVLIDGQRLAELMIDHDVGVSVAATYAIKRLDSDYFDD